MRQALAGTGGDRRVFFCQIWRALNLIVCLPALSPNSVAITLNTSIIIVPRTYSLSAVGVICIVAACRAYLTDRLTCTSSLSQSKWQLIYMATNPDRALSFGMSMSNHDIDAIVVLSRVAWIHEELQTHECDSLLRETGGVSLSVDNSVVSRGLPWVASKSASCLAQS